MLPKERLEELTEKSIPKKERLAKKPTDNAELLSAIRFVVHGLSEESMRLNQYVAKPELFKDFPNLPRRYKRVFRKAYRLLKIDWQTQNSIPGIIAKESWLKLEKGWIRHFFNSTGVDFRDPLDLQAFRRLNPYLVIDEAMRLYSEAHPIERRARLFLSGTVTTSKRQRKQQPDTPFTSRAIDPDPAPPAAVSDHERLMNKLQQGIHSNGGRITREQHDALPTEVMPDTPPPESPRDPLAEAWHEQIMRRLNRR